MRRLLDDDISVMNLEYGESEFSEESEEDKDFATLIAQIEKQASVNWKARR